MLAITQGADEALDLLRTNIDGLPDEAGLRISPEADEDGEPGYALEVVQGPEEGDAVIEGHPLRVFVAAEAVDGLDAAALDGEVHGDHVHFGIVDVSDEG